MPAYAGIQYSQGAIAARRIAPDGFAMTLGALVGYGVAPDPPCKTDKVIK